MLSVPFRSGRHLFLNVKASLGDVLLHLSFLILLPNRSSHISLEVIQDCGYLAMWGQAVIFRLFLHESGAEL